MTSFDFPWPLKKNKNKPTKKKTYKKHHNATYRRVKLACSHGEKALPWLNFNRNTEVSGLAVSVSEDGLYVVVVLR